MALANDGGGGANVGQGALKAIWEASDRLCAKRLRTFLPEIVRVLRNNIVGGGVTLLRKSNSAR